MRSLPAPTARSGDQDVFPPTAVEDAPAPAPAPGQHVVAVPAAEGVVAGRADQSVVAVLAILRQEDRAGREARGVHRVLAVPRVDDELVLVPLGAVHRHGGGQADHRGGAARALDVNVVIVVGAVDGNGVGLAVTAPRAGLEVEVDLGEVGAGQVVDGDGVGPAEGVKVHPFHVVEVHSDVGDVAGEADAVAVAGDVDLL